MLSPVLSSKAASGEREYNLYELLYAVVLGDEYREGIGAGQLLACGDVDVLVRDHILYTAIGLHNGILHQDTVFDDSTLLDLAAAEQHAVLDGALDDAAISQQAVLDGAACHIAGGVILV